MILVLNMLKEGIVLGQIRSVKSRLISERSLGRSLSQDTYNGSLSGECGADKGSATYANKDALPSSSTSSRVRENTFYSKDREACWWPHPIEHFVPNPSTVSQHTDNHTIILSG